MRERLQYILTLVHFFPLQYNSFLKFLLILALIEFHPTPPILKKCYVFLTVFHYIVPLY